MFRLFHHTQQTSYWLKVFAWYAFTEACIQLLYLFILNNFGDRRITIPELHLVMWFFQCLLIAPIWRVAQLVSRQLLVVQVTVNLLFYVLYTWFWFGPVQDAIAYCYNNLQEVTRPVADREPAYLDKGNESSYVNYQLLKHAFRLSWFYLASYFYNYRLAEKERLQLAVANKELQLKMLSWRLNPSFYFKTIDYLKQVAGIKPAAAAAPILQLSKVMEYVIYDAKETMVPVKKEMIFLENYIRLLNEQPGNNIFFHLTLHEENASFKIVPLLLTGVLDDIKTSNNGTVKEQYDITIHLLQNELRAAIRKQTGGEIVLPAASPAVERITKIYPEAFSFSAGNHHSIIQICICSNAS